MSLRVRSDGRVLCAAMHEAEDGDCYIDDGVHYLLSVEAGVLVSEPMDLSAGIGRGGHAAHGEWWWRDRVPSDVVIEQRCVTPRVDPDSVVNPRSGIKPVDESRPKTDPGPAAEGLLPGILEG